MTIFGPYTRNAKGSDTELETLIASVKPLEEEQYSINVQTEITSYMVVESGKVSGLFG